tara:strand:+ start:61 stop:714 length:654 start_codon:yes stop_codon:yes gene_type:complete
MKPKKNPRISLENKKGVFFQIGLITTLLIVLVAFEWKSYEKSDYSLGQVDYEDLEEEIIPITQEEVKPPPPPPPPPEVIEIVEDEVEIEEELEIEDTEADEEMIVEIEEESDEDFFTIVEEMPEFPGGELALMKYITRKIKYPPIAKEYNITGKVYVSFIVDKSGSVGNVKVVRGVDKSLDAEAIRVIKTLPRYKPGKQRGKPVKVQFTVPINFTLN